MVESSSAQEIVLITGITGYIGSQVALSLFQETGSRFKVRASVRSLTNKNKLIPLLKAFGEENYNKIEFVEADLTDKESLFNAIAGVSYILHVASPIPGATKLNEDDMILPARNGMLAILEACEKYKVKKIVVTSSLATILGSHWKKDKGENHYTESDFAPYESSDSYGKSKIAQEQVIRDYISKNQGQDITEIVTIHPTFVIGPTLTSEKVSSPEGISKFMKREIPGVPALALPSVDVRDVALGHVRALLASGLHGKRIITTNKTMSLTEIADILDSEFKQYGYRVQTRRIGYCPLKMASWFDSQVKLILPLVGSNVTADNKLSTELLGLQYERDLKQTVIEMGYSLIEQGLVPDLRKK